MYWFLRVSVCSKRSFFYWGRSENFRRSNNISTFFNFFKSWEAAAIQKFKSSKIEIHDLQKVQKLKNTNITFENVQKFKKFKCWNYNIGKVEKVEKIQKLIFCSQKSSKVQKLKFGRLKSWKSWKVGCQSGLAKENAWLVAPLRFSPMAAVEGWGAAPLGAAPRPSTAAEAHWSFHYWCLLEGFASVGCGHVFFNSNVLVTGFKSFGLGFRGLIV